MFFSFTSSTGGEGIIAEAEGDNGKEWIMASGYWQGDNGEGEVAWRWRG
jgi:hypothetical protein